ncbi:glycosyltransferase [Bacillus sp. es.034]|uniref:glycosyltransferase n=1 Tax=Bacillus sp. es.034 TaxID=1761763 RepID=UPI000BF43064|nr:glycosyltransferase [Bacillus sp. es.034]PFG04405.1 glycosyltransferase involved in cell wall biosynthesis [Bacillus sp. es.034]
MKKNVCMYVWNHFTNDARVMRECTALSENGYNVDLICIDDPKDKSISRYEEMNPHFHVYRVRRYPLLLELLQKVYRISLKHKMIGLLLLLAWLSSAFLAPLVVLPVSAILFLFWRTKLSVVWVRGSIILRMIARGWQKKYDIYHSNDLNTLPQGYICAKWRINNKKLVYDSHEVQTSRTGYDSGAYAKMEGFLINKIDTMIVENHTRAKYNEELYGFYPGVVYNYPFKQKESLLDQEKVDLHQMLGLPKDEKILLYQGGIQTGRGLENLVKAVPLFKEGTLVFIGDGRIKPTLVKMVEDMKLQDRVKFIPKVPLKELPKYTRNAYLGFQVLNNVCFNHYSASSNKLFEYMMSGVPVVACSFPEIKKVVEENRIGICVDSHDYEDISKAVNYLLKEVEVRNEMSQNSKSASKTYNWDLEKDKFYNIYNQLLIS